MTKAFIIASTRVQEFAAEVNSVVADMRNYVPGLQGEFAAATEAKLADIISRLRAIGEESCVEVMQTASIQATADGELTKAPSPEDIAIQKARVDRIREASQGGGDTQALMNAVKELTRMEKERKTALADHAATTSGTTYPQDTYISGSGQLDGGSVVGGPMGTNPGSGSTDGAPTGSPGTSPGTGARMET